MLSNHACSDSCFAHLRPATKQKINCLLCKNPSNMKCYNVTATSVIQTLALNSNVVFLCSNCHHRVSQMKEKENTRRSTGAKKISAPSIDGSQDSPDLNKSSAANSNSNSQMMEMLVHIKQKLDKLDQASNELVNKPIEKAKEDTEHTISPNYDEIINKLNEEITSKFSILHAKIANHFTKIETLITNNNNKSMVSKENSRNSIYHSALRNSTQEVHNKNPLEWSMVFNQSIDTDQNGDSSELYPLLASFEQSSWASFDLIKKLIENNSSKLLDIEQICKNV